MRRAQEECKRTFPETKRRCSLGMPAMATTGAAGPVSGNTRSGTAAAPLHLGTIYVDVPEERRHETDLTRGEFEEFARTGAFTNLPVCIEHKTGARVGAVRELRLERDGQGRLVAAVTFQLDGKTQASRALEKLLKEGAVTYGMSLRHDIGPSGSRTPVEVSICRRGARSNTWVLASHSATAHSSAAIPQVAPKESTRASDSNDHCLKMEEAMSKAVAALQAQIAELKQRLDAAEREKKAGAAMEVEETASVRVGQKRPREEPSGVEELGGALKELQKQLRELQGAIVEQRVGGAGAGTAVKASKALDDAGVEAGEGHRGQKAPRADPELSGPAAAALVQKLQQGDLTPQDCQAVLELLGHTARRGREAAAQVEAMQEKDARKVLEGLGLFPHGDKAEQRQLIAELRGCSALMKALPRVAGQSAPARSVKASAATPGGSMSAEQVVYEATRGLSGALPHPKSEAAEADQGSIEEDAGRALLNFMSA